jgi:hypothetical protein
MISLDMSQQHQCMSMNVRLRPCILLLHYMRSIIFEDSAVLNHDM